MATESISDRREHLRSIGVTSLTALIGVGVAYASFLYTGEPATAEAIDAASSDGVTYLFVLGAIAVLIGLIKATGIYGEDELGPKHYLFVAFMTFSFWFVTWGILLTSHYPA